MKKQSILISTLILTAATTLTRVIGFVFRIYLANVIKAEGMGLYQLIMSFYMLAVTFAVSGISIAVSRLISEEITLKHYANAKKVMTQSIYISLFTGITAAVFLYFGAEKIGIHLLNDERTVISMKYLSLTLPFIAVSACYKGYFYAVGKVLKPASAQILEQIIRVLVIFCIMGLYIPKGLDYACLAVAIGMTAEEIFSCVYVWFMYVFDKKPFSNKSLNKKADPMLFRIVGITVPLAATSYVNAILRMVENILIPSRLILYGISTASAMSLYGMVKGMVLPLLFFPSSFLSSLSSLLIPSLAGAKAGKNEKKITYTLSNVLHFTILSGILVVSIFLCFSYEIGMSVYNDNNVGILLKSISFVCPFMYINMVIISMLNALGEEASTFKINIIESVLKISMIYFLIPLYGFNAYLTSLFITTVINTFLYMIRLLQVSCIIFDISNWIIKPVTAGIISGISVKFLFLFILVNLTSPIIALITAFLVLCIVYFLLLTLFKSLPKNYIRIFKH